MSSLHSNPTRPVFYGYWIVLAAFVTQFIAVGMQNYVAGAFMTPMSDEFGWTRAEFTSARSIGQMVVAITGFVIGSALDRYGGRPFILVGTVILSLSVFALGGVQTLTQWLILNGLILTIGAAMIGNLVVNVTLGKWFVRQRGRAVAVAAMGVSLGGIVLPPLATWLVDLLGWRDAWHVLGIVVAVFTFPAALLVRRAPEDYGMCPDGAVPTRMTQEETSKANLDYDNSLTRSQAMRTGHFYKLVLAFGLFQISVTVMLLQTIPFMSDAGYPRLMAASMLSLASIPAFLSKPLWGVWIDYYRPKPLAAIGAAITGMSVIFIVLSVKAQVDVLVYASFLLMGVGWGGLIPLQEVIWASYFGRRYLGAVRSTAMPFSFAMSAAGPIIAAAYYDQVGNYDNAFLAMGLCNLGSALMLMRMSDKAPDVVRSE
ncbi:MAG: MFS transporter [Gammaproteobacteria bacterium]|nr:MFS transporter [Gammaproteobacteria bacterium]